MPALKLNAHSVAKPWGRSKLLPAFRNFETEELVGEIWFDQPDDAELLVKYLFTSERLSVQVHPDEVFAKAAGYPRGKDEFWYILDAAPDAMIGLGPMHPITSNELRRAALEGDIVDLLHWRPVAAGDVIYSPAGTIHAIGAGLTLIEIQQNLDVTYRLYDHGRPRALQLDKGVAVSMLAPFRPACPPAEAGILAAGRKFVVERMTDARICSVGSEALLIPVSGQAAVNGEMMSPGECWSASGIAAIEVQPGAEVLLAYPGAKPL